MSNRFDLAAKEVALLVAIAELEGQLRTVRAEQAQDDVFGSPMKWIEVHFIRETGGSFQVRETLPLYGEPRVERWGMGGAVHHRPDPVVTTVHLNPSKARRVYETFRAEGAQPLHIGAAGVAAHAPWSKELEELLRSC